jgi:hypothetical protein
VKTIFLFFLTLLPSVVFSQEKVCVPKVWKGEVVKGTIFLTNGDSLQGKFTHLTPYNDIKTTHIIYKEGKKDKVYINRADIAAYKNLKTKEYRLKVYVNTDSTHFAKGCFFDQGKFLIVVESGKYTILQDELNFHSSITSYNQSSAKEVYYILLPSSKLVKVILSDLKAQMMSIIIWESDLDIFTSDDIFTIEDMIEVIKFANSDQSKR